MRRAPGGQPPGRRVRERREARARAGECEVRIVHPACTTGASAATQAMPRDLEPPRRAHGVPRAAPLLAPVAGAGSRPRARHADRRLPARGRRRLRPGHGIARRPRRGRFSTAAIRRRRGASCATPEAAAAAAQGPHRVGGARACSGRSLRVAWPPGARSTSAADLLRAASADADRSSLHVAGPLGRWTCPSSWCGRSPPSRRAALAGRSSRTRVPDLLGGDDEHAVRGRTRRHRARGPPGGSAAPVAAHGQRHEHQQDARRSRPG